MSLLPATNRILKVAVLATALLAFADNALANQIKITFDNDYRAGSGGEFTVNAVDAASVTLMGMAASAYDSTAPNQTFGVGELLSFQTFCLEKDEFLSDDLEATYTVATSANNGGVGGPDPDEISNGTAWLYRQFAAGTLAGYDYTPGVGRQNSALALQQAIWILEQEETDTETNAFVNSMVVQFGGLAGAMADNAGTFGVFALNLRANCSGGVAIDDCQDVMVAVPDGGLTLMMLGVGLSGLAVLRRKMV